MCSCARPGRLAVGRASKDRSRRAGPADAADVGTGGGRRQGGRRRRAAGEDLAEVVGREVAALGLPAGGVCVCVCVESAPLRTGQCLASRQGGGAAVVEGRVCLAVRHPACPRPSVPSRPHVPPLSPARPSVAPAASPRHVPTGQARVPPLRGHGRHGRHGWGPSRAADLQKTHAPWPEPEPDADEPPARTAALKRCGAAGGRGGAEVSDGGKCGQEAYGPRARQVGQRLGSSSRETGRGPETEAGRGRCADMEGRGRETQHNSKPAAPGLSRGCDKEGRGRGASRDPIRVVADSRMAGPGWAAPAGSVSESLTGPQELP